MAFDILPHGVEDPTSLVLTGGGATDFSPAVALNSPQYGALALLVTATVASPDTFIDVILQTAASEASPGAQGWIDTTSRVRIPAGVSIGDAVSFQIPCVDPVLDQVRAKVVFAGANATELTLRWLADRPIPAPA